MPKLTYDPTGTVKQQSQLAVGIRQQYRDALKTIEDHLKKNRKTVERMIVSEATIGIDAIDFIMNGMSGVNENMKPLVYGVLGSVWNKSNLDTSKMLGNKIIRTDVDVLRAVQNNSFGYIQKLTEDNKANLRRILTDGVTQGDSITDISKEIRQSFRTTSYRSELIARTEVIRSYNEGAMSTMKTAGVKKYKWKAALDEVTGDLDRWLNGQTFPMGQKGTFTTTVNGKQYTVHKSPKPVVDTHPNCRCRTIPVVNV